MFWNFDTRGQKVASEMRCSSVGSQKENMAAPLSQEQILCITKPVFVGGGGGWVGHKIFRLGFYPISGCGPAIALYKFYPICDSHIQCVSRTDRISYRRHIWK